MIARDRAYFMLPWVTPERTQSMIQSKVRGASLDPSAISDEAQSLVRESLVWDDLMPWTPELNLEEIDTLLPRFKNAGVNFISLTLAAGAGLGSSLDNTMRLIARVR